MESVKTLLLLWTSEIMVLDLTILSNDLDFIINDIPITVIINGNSYIGSRGSVDTEIIYLEDGSDNKDDFTIYLNKNTIGVDIPTENGIVTIASVSYRVIKIVLDSIDQLYTVTLSRQYV